MVKCHIVALLILLWAMASTANNIYKFSGCSDENKALIKTAYRDALRLAQHVNPWLYKCAASVGGQTSCKDYPPGVLEKRYFGSDNGFEDRRQDITFTFHRAANWYPWWGDFIWGKNIEVSCVDIQNVKKTSCAREDVGAYALNENGGPQIVLCKPFYSKPSLDQVKKTLDSHPSNQKNAGWYESSARLFFHEMMHLTVISGKDPDNYAQYVSEAWFSQFYGQPDPSINAADNDGSPGSEIEDGDDYGSSDAGGTDVSPTGYDDPDFDWIQQLEAEAFQAGYYIDGSNASSGDFDPSRSIWLKNKELRILALGDSITQGFQSSTGNGYRGPLYDLLVANGNVVSMIGSQSSGTMSQPLNEGHDGAVIAQIATYTSAYGQRPNVILLHAGTNDMNQPSDPDTAPQRLDSLVGQVLDACPDATVIVARIIQSQAGATQSRIVTYNDAIARLMRTRGSNGQHVFMVDMGAALTPDSSDMADDLHPNDKGYSQLATMWAIGLTRANSLGWIKDPLPAGPATHRNPCTHKPNWISQDKIANGAGLGPSLFLTTVCPQERQDGPCSCQPVSALANPSVFNVTSADLRPSGQCDQESLTYPLASSIHFADLNGDGRAEYLYVNPDGAVTAYLNLGGPDNGPNAAKVAWLPQGQIASGVGAIRNSIQFADLNGDGRAEYLWIHDDGSVDCWLNLGGSDDGPNAAKVAWLPQGKIANGIGLDGTGVVFADLNGDGRAEYLYVHGDGSVTAYLNLGGPDNGPNAAKVAWLPQGVIATGVGKKRINAVFADINGDGRADYCTIDRVTGAMSVWLNGGGPDDGPHAAQVVWYPQGQVASGVGTTGYEIQLADMNGDARAEYLDVDPDTSAVTAWLNGC
ncbi:hypothetical protein LTR10_004339 [Elasticomyces elasticus]|nr:hypothetical protein LTR10_004339 [Elasticomyces elasticus]KAK4976659.1 hypothetical protein LTR42_002702 [Elasticomyces elasticus]